MYNTMFIYICLIEVDKCNFCIFKYSKILPNEVTEVHIRIQFLSTFWITLKK